MKILVTGAKGFIGGYVIEELLLHDYQVIGIDNLSKYGNVKKSYDSHHHYTFLEADAKDLGVMKEAIGECSHFVAGAAMIGGISYFHKYAYDLLSENERILASSFDAAIWANQNRQLEKITVLSSSMVFESTKHFPTKEGDELTSPPPVSTYGFQKLSTEYFARGAWEQYGLPYTIIRPFNCVGIGEQKAVSDITTVSGNIEIALSHVVPDLIQKILKGQDPLHILGTGEQVRHYTYGGDIARAIRLSLENPKSVNEDFNISHPVSMTVLEVAELIWKKIHPRKPFRYTCDEPYPYDIQKRIPDVRKAKEILDFEANTDLDQILDMVIPWVREQIALGNI